MTISRKWRFGTSSALTLAALLVFGGSGLVAFDGAYDELNSEAEWTWLLPVVPGVISIACVAGLIWFRSRNYVEIREEEVRVIVAGRQFNRSNDIVFLLPKLPKWPASFPAAVRCQDGERTVTLPLLGQNKFWTPIGMKQFAKRLDARQIKWRWV